MGDSTAHAETVHEAARALNCSGLARLALYTT